LSLPHVEIGQPLEGREQRNPLGWLLFAALAALVIVTQLANYFGRTPSMEIVRARILQQIQTQLTLENLPGAAAPALGEQSLSKAADELRPKIADDPETALLYAIVKTEAHATIKPAELMALRGSKNPVHKTAYKIYSTPRLDPAKAKELAAKLPSQKFENRLIAAHALEKADIPGARDAIQESDSAWIKALLVGLLVVLALFAGLALIVTFLTLRSRGLVEPKGLPLSDLTKPDADRVAMRTAQIFVTFLAAAYVAPTFLGRALPVRAAQILVYLVIVAMIVLLAKVPVDGKWIRLNALGIRRENLGRNILWGVGGAVANLPILAVVLALSIPLNRFLPPAEHPATVELMQSSSPLVILQMILMACVFAPFIEEVMFRGTLFPALSKLLSKPVWAAILSSLVFAAIHPTGIPAWPALATIGGMSCFLSYQTKSLVPSIVMHGVHNLATLLITVTLMQ
jgi:membrane protease YdiL (CAAX protease family)